MRSPSIDLDSTTDRWLGGEEGALRDAYDAWATPIHTFCVRRVGAADGADATQQVFVEAWRTRDRFDPARGTLPQWLFGIARNTCHSMVRRRARRAEVPADSSVESMGTATGIDRATDRLIVQHALTCLSPRQRLVIEDTYYLGRTNQEIADRHAIPLGTVKSDLRRGLAMLRNQIEVRS